VYRVYGWLALGAGFVLAAWGPAWFGTDLAGLPFVKAALVRIAGAMVMGAGLVAMAVAGTDDPEGRRRGFLWFGLAHALVVTMILVQVRAIPAIAPSNFATGLVIGGLATWMLLFFHLFTTANGWPSPRAGVRLAAFWKYGVVHTSLSGRSAAAGDLRSRCRTGGALERRAARPGKPREGSPRLEPRRWPHPAKWRQCSTSSPAPASVRIAFRSPLPLRRRRYESRPPRPPS
jgi:hypothetical protein